MMFQMKDAHCHLVVSDKSNFIYNQIQSFEERILSMRNDATSKGVFETLVRHWWRFRMRAL